MANVSKLRWLTGVFHEKKEVYYNVLPTSTIWDYSPFIAANDSFVAVPWASMGCVAIIHQNHYEKLPGSLPLAAGHKGAVLDVQFSPHEKNLLCTASEDTHLKLFRVPDQGLAPGDSNLAAVSTLSGHTKKCGIIQWHPSAQGILASAALDHCVHVWDAAAEAPKLSFPKNHKDIITSLQWNLDGSVLASMSKDKMVRLFDSRTGEIAASTQAHPGVKTQRMVYAKNKDRIIVIGFNKQQFRQVMAFDPRKMDAPLNVEEIDQQSSIAMPFVDEELGAVFAGAKGESSIKMFDLNLPEFGVKFVAEYKGSPDYVQKGLAMVPKTQLDQKKAEVARFYKLSNKTLSCLHINLPRRTAAAEFQSDLFPPCFAPEPALTSAEFFQGKNSAPKLMDLEPFWASGPNAVVNISENDKQSTDSAAVPTKAAPSPAKSDAPSPAKADSSKDEARSPAKPTAPAAAEPAAPAKKEWDGKSEPSEEQVKEQEDAVAALKKQLAEAEARLCKMNDLRPKTGGKDPKSQDEAQAEAKKATPEPEKKAATPPPEKSAADETKKATPPPERKATPEPEKKTATPPPEKKVTPEPEKKTATPPPEQKATPPPQEEKKEEAKADSAAAAEASKEAPEEKKKTPEPEEAKKDEDKKATPKPEEKKEEAAAAPADSEEEKKKDEQQ